MDGLRGVLLASVATAALGRMTAAELAKGRYMRAPDGHEGGGGAEALLEDDDPPADPPKADDPPADPPADPPKADDPDFAWATGVKAEPGEGQDASNLDWLKGTKVKDLDSLVQIARDNQRALRESGRVKIPGADAKPEEIAAYREAMGVPETEEGYEIKLPDGLDAEKYEVDGKFLDPLRKVALEHNVPAAAFSAFADAFMRQQAEDLVATATANNTKRDEHVKSWGAEAGARKEEFRRGAQVLGLDKAAIARMQSGYGVGETMDLIAKIGNMAGEDFFANGKAAERFGVADLESAQKALDELDGNAENRNKLNKSHKDFDRVLVAKRNRLIEAVSHYKALAAAKP